MKKILCLLILFSQFAFSQLEKKIDSIEKILLTSKNFAELDKCYNILAELYIDNDPEKARLTINKYFKFSIDKKCSGCEAKAFYLQGHFYDRVGKPQQSVKSFENSANIALLIKDYHQYQRSYTWKIQILISNRNNYQLVEDELKKYEAIAAKHQIKEGWHLVYFLYALNYYQRGYLKKSIEYYIKADKYVEDNKLNVPEFQMGVLNNMAQVYKELDDYSKTKSYVEQAMKQAITTKDSYNIMNIVLHKGVIEADFKNFDRALPHLENSYSYYNKINNSHYKGSSALYLSIVYYRLNRFKEAKLYNAIAEKIYTDELNKVSLGETLAYKTLICLKTNEINLAKASILKTNKLFENQKDNPTYPTILESEIAYHTQLNNFKEALRLTREKDSLRKILEENFKSTEISELEVIYQTEKKVQEIELLKAKNEVSEKQKYIYIAIAGLLLISGLFLLLGYRNKIKTAQKLNELNELKSRFFANISHEFRTPLTLIKSPIQQLQKEIVADEQNKQLHLIDHNANRMLELVDQLLELSKIDSGKLSIILKKGNLQHFFQSIVEPFSFKAKEENQEFTITTENLNIETPFDKDIITKITTNLLDNAFKYNEPGKPITFVAKKENQHLILIVSNYNPQIKEADDKKLFERFYQKDMAISGFGIGLSLVKDLVELYEGTIKTEFNHSQISFIVELPLKKELKHAVVVDHNSAIDNKIKTTIDESTSTLELPILMVVDDNPSIREVLKDIFNANFQILEASNGKEALKMAQKEIPDAIISDVMMPEMDGFEFTQQIKNNELTSFIPVILLTAKTSDENHLKALHNTADAFLTKPFNHEILKATVFHQIQERRKLQERYSQELILKPTEVSINSVDEKFIAKLATVMEKAITNSDFNAEIFADEMHISRMQLHRKLKSLFGVSATEFIRNERLKVAADLLKNDKLSVSEIAYTVGFNDVGYFSKCFKEMYQQSPSEFQKK